MNYGLLDALQGLEEYVAGQSKIPWIEYNESGDWEASLPMFEAQARYYETNGCTVFGALNQIETLYKFLYGTEPNYAEKYNYLLIPVDPLRGADPQKMYECVRKEGVVDNDLLPLTESREDFLDASDITGSIRAKGQNWLVKHDFKHEWLWETPPANALDILKAALKTSPIAVSVTAWYEENGVYVDRGARNNHWCLVYRVDDRGIHVYDSYDKSKKILSKTHFIGRAKRIWINRKTRSALRKHRSLLQIILERLMQKKNLLDVCTAYLGKDASPQQLTSDEVACAETVSYLLKQVYPSFPILTGTWTLRNHLTKPTGDFIEVTEPEPGAIVISATGTGKSGSIGHVGIVMEDGTIASNNSFGVFKGKFTKNYTPETWHKRYVVGQGMEMRYFRHV